MASTSLHHPAPRGPQPRALHLELECDFATVRHGAQKVRGFLEGQGLFEEDVWACELCFVESCNNIVQHTTAAQQGPLSIQLNCEEGEVELQIRDRSAGFHFPESASLPPPDAEQGRGLFLMRSLMTVVEYLQDEEGNCLILKRLLRKL